MPGYLVADIEVTDPEKYEEYRRQVIPLLEKYDVTVHIGSSSHERIEGDWEPHFLAVLECESMEKLKEFWNSPESRRVEALRRASTNSKILFIDD